MSRFFAVLLAAAMLIVSPSLARADASEEYTQDEIYSAATGFFATTSEALADVVQKAFEDHGRPNAYITGEEAGGAIVFGLRYGNGTLNRKTTGPAKIYWQGPSVGFDLGGNAAKTFILIYDLDSTEELHQRIPGVDGTAYLVAGVGMTYLRSDDLVLAPIQTGVGARFGVNVGYLHFNKEHTWNPF